MNKISIRHLWKELVELKIQKINFFVPYLTDAGYPNWNADLPMPLYSFFEEYDFSGKTIIPFVAHGGSGASGTVDTIAELEPDATVVDNPATVYWDELDDAERIVTDWVKSLNITK